MKKSAQVFAKIISPFDDHTLVQRENETGLTGLTGLLM